MATRTEPKTIVRRAAPLDCDRSQQADGSVAKAGCGDKHARAGAGIPGEAKYSGNSNIARPLTNRTRNDRIASAVICRLTIGSAGTRPIIVHHHPPLTLVYCSTSDARFPPDGGNDRATVDRVVVRVHSRTGTPRPARYSFTSRVVRPS